MKRIVPLLALAIGVATVADAATAPAAKTAPKPATTARTTTATKKSTPPATKQTASKRKRAQKSESRMHLGFRAIGGSLGFVSPENSDGTMTLGVFADCGRITPQIVLEPRLDFWSKSEEAFGAKASVRDVILGARGRYLFETSNPRLQPFAGAGLSMHFIRSEVTIQMPGYPEMTSEDSATRLGLDIGGGVSTPVGLRTDLTGEMWYGIVSDVSQFSLRVGMSYRMGQ